MRRFWVVLSVALHALLVAPAAHAALTGPSVMWRLGQGVRALVQAHDGYVWVGTDQGLVRLDGGEPRRYQVPHGPLGGFDVLAPAAPRGVWARSGEETR